MTKARVNADNASADIQGVTAGTGISGGGTSGTVTITNDMATAIDAKGDLVVGTGADTYDNLTVGTNEHRLVAASGEATGLKYVADTTNYAIAAKGNLLVGTAADTVAALTVGANNTVLTADSAEATGLKWATPSSGSMTVIASGSLSGSSVSISSIPSTYLNLRLVIRGIQTAVAGYRSRYRINGNSGTNYRNASSNSWSGVNPVDTSAILTSHLGNGSTYGSATIDFYDYANTTTWKRAVSYSVVPDTSSPTSNFDNSFNTFFNIAAISSLELLPDSGSTFTAGTYILYGVN